jgi:hypothetical protein
MIGSHPFQAANGDWLFLNTIAPTGWLARTIADASEDSWKYVGFAILHVRIAELPLGNHANVRWNIGVRRTAPLTVYDFVKVLGIGGICWLHSDDVPVQSLLVGVFLASLKGG